MTTQDAGIPLVYEPRGGVPDFRVKSGARVVAVLDFFQRFNRPARAYEIGRALDLAPSSANDLLKTLVEVGYLDFDAAEKTYFPGIRVGLLGHWLARLHPELNQLEDFARNLSRECGEHVVLFAQRQHKIQVLSIRPGEVAPPVNIYEGASLPVFGTAAGCALLMLKSHMETYDIVRKTFRTKSCSHAVVSIGGIVQDCKRRGYASSVREDIVPDNWAIALPLPIKVSESSIVVGLGGPTARVQRNERQLVALAHSMISNHFGQMMGHQAGQEMSPLNIYN
ncbi:MAG: helix-turn-helix domain-containing protein [Parasphingorhabdus sp.]|uniref:IclR family transcriptional regulator n=1 Tax=Parasphingorhabdus sp. TaxID=2709688 RepID=UPI003001C8E0